MIVVKLQGGLGNQMFQYAMGKSLAHHYATNLKLDHCFLEDRSKSATHVFRNYDLDIFGLNAQRASDEDRAFFFKKPGVLKMLANKTGLATVPEIIVERQFHFDPSLYKRTNNLYLDGYWQTPCFFANITPSIRDDFKFKRPLLPQSAALLQQLEAEDLVCINVRRSDFLTNSFHPVCGLDYFKPAMDLAASRLVRPHFLVFSDDIEWCRQNFNSHHPLTIIDHSHKGQKFDNYLQMMSCCQHFIIPNSSFAWWAVWLANRKNNIVVAPKTWFNDPAWDTKDLIPSDWIRLNNFND